MINNYNTEEAARAMAELEEGCSVTAGGPDLQSFLLKVERQRQQYSNWLKNLRSGDYVNKIHPGDIANKEIQIEKVNQDTIYADNLEFDRATGYEVEKFEKGFYLYPLKTESLQ